MTAEDVLAIRASAVALVAQCDAALARMEREATPAPLPDGECPHPQEQLISTATAGHPHRAKCRLCGATVERTA